MESVVSYVDGKISLVMSRTEAHEWTVELRQDGRLTFGDSYRTKREALSAVRRIRKMRRKI